MVDPLEPPSPASEPLSLFPVVAIGASAGGLPAISALLASLPAALPAALVVITHAAPDVKSHLAEILIPLTKLPVREITGPQPVRPGLVFVLPAGHDLVIEAGQLQLMPRENTPVHHPIDRFLASLARDRGPAAVAVILSGAGSDGSLGLRDLHAGGGLVIVQDPATAEHAGMPDSAIATGLADAVLPVADIGPYLAMTLAVMPPGATAIPAPPDDCLGRITAVLLAHTGHDFSDYKPSTLARRVQKRMLLSRTTSHAAYEQHLADDLEECSRLFHDLLIGVTAFFRDPPAFEALSRALPGLLAGRTGGDVRAWVAGCSSGEEAYTVAMLLDEQVRGSAPGHPVKIFATDIDPSALETARKGCYGTGVAQDIGAPRLARYFRCDTAGCTALPQLREQIVFARHDLVRDPPFLGMDCIICRNFLIYLTPEGQAKVLSVFAHALRPGGLLLLGTAETLGPQSGLFEVVDQKWRLFRRKTSPAAIPPDLTARFARLGRCDLTPSWRRVGLTPPDPEGLTEALLLDRYAPPAALLDLEGNVLRLSGNTAPFLALPQGEPTLSVHKLAHKALRPHLRAAMQEALAQDREHVRGPIWLDGPPAPRINLRVLPVLDANGQTAFLLLVFEPVAEAAAGQPPPSRETLAECVLISRYETEIERANDQLQQAVERYETLNEELKASNEELTSMNEELQTSNEEMDASREELQSLNEELTSLNAELQSKVDELARSRAFVETLLAATDLPTVVLDQALRVERYTPAALVLFHLVPTDQGRGVEEIKTTFASDRLVEDCRRVLHGGDMLEREIRNTDDRWFLQRAHPYRDQDGQAAGLVLTFAEVTTLKQAEAILTRGKEELEALVASRTEELAEKVRLLDMANVVVRDMDARITLWNTGAEELYGYSRAEALGQVSYRLLRTIFPEPYGQILDTLQRTGRWTGELRKFAKDGRPIDVATLWLLNRDAAGNPVSILEVGSDVTERNRLEIQARRWDRVFETADFGLVHVNAADNTFLEVNQAFARERGYTPEELLGRSLLMIHPPELREKAGAFICSVDATGHGVFESEHVRKDGSRFPVLVEVTTLRDASGRTASRVAYALDISERVKAEEAIRDMARFPSENPHPVLRVGSDMVVLHANKASEAFLAAQGCGLGQTFPAGLAPYLDQALQQGRPVNFEAAADGRQYVLSASPVAERGYFNVYGMDITERKQAEADLRKSEARLRQLVDAAPDAIIIQSQGRFAYLNPAAERLFGLKTPGELMGQPIIDHMHPDDREMIRERIRKTNTERVSLPPVLVGYLRRDGSTVMVEALSAPFEYQGHSGSLVFARDVTERLRDEEQRRRQVARDESVARVRDAYLAHRDSEAIFDQALTEILALTASQYGFIAELRTDDRGRTFQQCLAISNIAWDEETRRFYEENAPGGLVFHALDGLNATAVVTGEPVIADDPARDPRRSGRLPEGHPPLDCFLGLPLFHGRECLGSMGLANRPGGYDEDVAAFVKPLAETCAQIVERLRAERRLVAAKQAAEAASLSKSEFLANMSHEIRTPLNGILGMLQLMQTTSLDGEQNEYVGNAITSSRRLTRLLSDILDLSLVESGRLSIRVAPCQPTDLRDAVLDLFSLTARDKGLDLAVHLEPDLPATILADEARLRQILFNLTGNAVKFTDRGAVCVTIGPASRRHDAGTRLLITVGDSGIGIPDEQIEAIFEPFGQVENVYVRRFGGAGLGLSIVRRLVRLLGGEIAVDSAEGLGTTMHVSLPLTRLPAAREAAPFPAAGREERRGLRILLAEDDAVSMLSFRRMLEKAGHRVTVAEDGTRVLGLLAEGDFDCILMDVQMPVMDGVAATRAIRTQPAFRDKSAIPIIAMTAYAMAGDRERFLEAGMDDYVGKPVDMEELKQTIERVVGGTNGRN